MIQEVKAADLRPDENNANRHTERGEYQVSKSIEKFGFRFAGTLDKHRGIVHGNNRHEKAGAAGIEDVVIIKADPNKQYYLQYDDLDLNDPANPARELSVVANRTAQVSIEFDTDILKDYDLAGIELGDWFTDLELGEFGIEGDGGAGDTADAEPQLDRAGELQKEWQTTTGQLWKLPSRTAGHAHYLICGDCTDKATVERVMMGEKAAAVFTDPPFGINLVPQRGLTQPIANDGNESARRLWANFLPLLKKHVADPAHLFICQGWTEFDWTLPLLRQYFTLKSKVVWNKNVWGIGYYTRPKHEDIIYCWNGTPETVDEPVSDVWDAARSASPDHAAEKPSELSAIAIKHFSKPGDVVADWFCGVGGVIIAAENLSRQCRAIEISPSYVAVALQRYFDATGIKPELVG